MAGRYEVIKEFLVGLGFQVEESEVKKFDNFLAGGEKRLLEFGGIALTAAASIQASVTVIADQFEKLYYSSQRTGTSVSNLQAFRFGAEQIGISAEATTAAVDAMVRSMQLQPGLPGLMARFGVNPNQLNKAEQLLQLMERLHKMPDYLGSRYAQMFGISDEFYRMMTPKRIAEEREWEALFRKLAADAGVDPDKLSEDSKAFRNEVRVLQAELMLFSMQVESSLLPVIQKFTKFLQAIDHILTSSNKWAKDNLPGGGALPAAEGILAAFGAAWGTKKLLGMLLGRGAAAAAGAGAGAGAGAVAAEGAAKVLLYDQFGNAIAGAAGAGATGGTVSLLGRLVMLAEAAPAAIGSAITSAFVAIPALGALGGLLANRGINAYAERTKSEAQINWIAAEMANERALFRNKPGVKWNNPGNLRVPGKMEFQHFGTIEEGFRAMARQILIDHSRGQNTIATLLGGINGKGGWSPAHENDLPRLIKRMSQITGFKPGQVINMRDPKTLALIMHAITAQEQGRVTDPGGKDWPTVMRMAAEAELHRRGRSDAPVTLNAQTTINGVPDANAVRREMDKSNEFLLRDLKGAVDGR